MKKLLFLFLLTNIDKTSCLSQLKIYELAEKYAKEIITIADKNNFPRFKAAGLNNLALILRKSGDPINARKCLEKAIDICQRISLISGEILNILNLGNTYKDQNDLSNAERCYQEGLTKSVAHGLKREEGRSLELISSIKYIKKDFEGVINFATKAIEIQKQTNDVLRIAESLIERAPAYVALNEFEKAAYDYEKAGDHYKSISKFEDAITCY